MATLPFYECLHCGKKLASQKAFDKHACDQKKRYDLARTPLGTKAFINYQQWLALKGGRVANATTFSNSKFFTSFIEFQQFATDKGIPDKELYIGFMYKKNISPSMWRNAMVYRAFIEYFDDEIPTMKKVRISLRTLDILGRIFECDISEIYDMLLPSEISRLVFERKLSPWLLLNSPKFMHYMHMIDDPAQHLMIRSVMDEREWKQIFKKNKEDVDRITSIISELEL